MTIGEGATEILRFAMARTLCASRADFDAVLPPLENLASVAGPQRAYIRDALGPAWRALQLAAEALQLVREVTVQECQHDDRDATWQCYAVGFADLATRLWVSIQTLLEGAKLIQGDSASQRHISLVKAFLIRSCIEICHRGSELLRTLGLTDANLLSAYIEALQIGAGNGS